MRSSRLLGSARRLLCRTALCGTAIAPLLAPIAARAEGGDSATVRLIQLLIQKGILTSGQATSLLAQAQQEATEAKAVRAAVPRPIAGTRVQAEEAAAPTVPGAPSGEVRVTYVPQFVRDQIAAEVRTQMLSDIAAQGWAKPSEVPDWIHRITLYGDLRLRYQANLENDSNSAGGGPFPFIDFNTINAGSGYDQTGNSGSPPQINVNQNRDRYRVRARIGVHAEIADWLSSDIRLATGSDNSPVTENQTLGSPGDFTKYAIWLDRAYLDFHPVPNLHVLAGRTPDPYFVTDLMYGPDVNFDGIAAQYTYPLTSNFDLFAIGGAHPVFNEALNFATDNTDKGSSHNGYLFAGQAGAQWTITPDYVAKFAAGYFAYSNITGKVSSPCFLFNSADTCSTDDTRPAFEQFGNTFIPLRNIVAISGVTEAAQPQYYGLASHFGILDLHGKFDIHNFDPTVISLEGEFAKNLEYNRSYILARGAVNNFGSCDTKANPNCQGPYQGGDTAYSLKLGVGTAEVKQLWDWNVSIAYKYLASDSVVDAFTDPDFHAGGTNAKGYVINGNLGVAPNTWVSARWLSAVQASGPPYAVDVLQIDMNTKF